MRLLISLIRSRFLLLFFVAVISLVVSNLSGTVGMSANPQKPFRQKDFVSYYHNAKILNIAEKNELFWGFSKYLPFLSTEKIHQNNIQSNFTGDLSSVYEYSLQKSGLKNQKTTESSITPTITSAALLDIYFVYGYPFTLEIRGSGFTSNSIVRWNGEARTTSFISSSKLIVTFPSSDANAGSHIITVYDPNGGVSNGFVYYIPPCTFTPESPYFTQIPVNGGTYGLTFRTQRGCIPPVSSNVPWITISASANGTSGVATYKVMPNSGDARSGEITLGSFNLPINQEAACPYTFTLSNSNINVPTGGYKGSFAINARGDCSWTVSTEESWIKILSNTSQSGTKSVSFQVQPNTGSSRSGVISVNFAGGSLNFVINQAPNCSFSLSSSNLNIDYSDVSGTVNVSAQNGCNWTANSNVSWITITNGTNGSGNGTVNFSISPNTGTARTGTLTIAGQTFTINQAGNCTYSLPSSVIDVSAASGSNNFLVVSGEGCNWTANSNVNWISINVASSNGTDFVLFSYQENTGAARFGTITVNGQIITISQASGRKVKNDFDGDGRADISVFRQSNGIWYFLNSRSRFKAVNFGISTDILTPADFDGDGKTDIAVWRKITDSSGFPYFYILNSSDGTVRAEQFGLATDIPVVADYDGDGKADPAVYRNGGNGGQSYFYYRPSSQPGTNFIAIAWGTNGDNPVPADYDGDGKSDVAVVRHSNGVSLWYILGSSQGFYGFQFGKDTDKPVSADYDGDGKADIAVFRPENGSWYIQRSKDGFLGFAFGVGSDKTVQADYDGDGKTDIAVYRDGIWYLQQSTNGFMGVEFGAATDIPILNIP